MTSFSPCCHNWLLGIYFCACICLLPRTYYLACYLLCVERLLYTIYTINKLYTNTEKYEYDSVHMGKPIFGHISGHGVLCDISYQLEAVNQCYKEFLLDVAGILDTPLILSIVLLYFNVKGCWHYLWCVWRIIDCKNDLMLWFNYISPRKQIHGQSHL